MAELLATRSVALDRALRRGFGLDELREACELLNQYRYHPHGEHPHTVILFTSIALFILAAFTDWLDGYLARRWKVESQFGRIMDLDLNVFLVELNMAFSRLAGSNQ